VILADGDGLTLNELPEMLRDLGREAPQEVPTGNSFEELLRLYKVSLANRTITECNGNKTRAARKLQVSRAYLHRLIRMGA
jgi:DNA-binding NtrC family response regulator